MKDNIKVYPTESFVNIENIMNNALTLNDAFRHFAMVLTMVNHTITHEEVQRLMMDPNEQFDAVIAEWMFSDLVCGFAAVFQCPLIWSSSMDPHNLVLSLIDEDPNPAYTPDNMSPVYPPFNFIERTISLLASGLMNYIIWNQRATELEVFTNGFGPAAAKRGHVLPSYDEVKYNGSLMLGNSHASSGLAVRLPQSYKPIGGYHIEDTVEPLPKEWQKIMDEAENGVIYFSMGSILKSREFPEQIKNGLLKVFRGLKQTVIWKFEDAIPDLPNNVHLVDWAPQQGILAHPNCILFITHGGLLSTTEALHFGVPLIGIPMFADQFNNVNKAVSKGIALHVKFNYDTPQNLKVAIEEMLGNQKYREKINELSFAYHHRPAPPSAEFVHWVEHVIATRGAPHLRSPALRVPIYQKMYLDLAAAVVVLVAVLVKGMKWMFASKKEDFSKKNR
ncbi:hypothetical protein ABMA28_008150 [Loxostege sticticalis]|uniref:UDP-glucuronosyltransferase n=1 Tax=Loxostege sticticalis TaxID=481309 RepID=A0ABD0SG59_LOXSC